MNGGVRQWGMRWRDRAHSNSENSVGIEEIFNHDIMRQLKTVKT